MKNKITISKKKLDELFAVCLMACDSGTIIQQEMAYKAYLYLDRKLTQYEKTD